MTSPNAVIAKGQIAPPFKLKNTQGEVIQLSDFAGQYVVLYFYPKDDTPGCTKQACAFRDLQAQYKQLNGVIIGVSPDEQASHLQFIEKYQLNFELLCDPSKKMMTEYSAWGEKNMYGKISMGVIRSTVLISPKGTIIQHWKRVSKADQHPTKVLEVLEKQIQSTEKP